ncbi:MAG: hypothetical protein J6Z24_04615 [Oscillospiraceae bacterium]|nr:hypothetical protein [Oscillospiraceae bacterium]
MTEFLDRLSSYGPILDIVSCVFTVLALVFTLYFWLLDNLNEEETKFLEGKGELLNTLKECRDKLKEDGTDWIEKIQEVTAKLEVVLNYRFWARSSRKEEYDRAYSFYQDSRYLISTLRRSGDKAGGQDSIVAVSGLSDKQIDDIKTDYRTGLNYIIDFIENWY